MNYGLNDVSRELYPVLLLLYFFIHLRLPFLLLDFYSEQGLNRSVNN